MPRIPRGDTTHSVFHVISRGVDRRAVFCGDADRRFFLNVMREAFKSYGVSLFAYCLMGNHFHLLLETSSTPLAIPMHELLLRYSLMFNRSQDRVGHLFQARYGAIPCRDLAHLIHLVAYIHKNPVRANLVASPGEWPWSSHDEFIDGPERFLSLGRLASATGMDADELREHYLERLAGTELELDRVATIIREAGTAVGVSYANLASGRRGPAFTRAKLLAIKLASRKGISLVELARGLNCTPSALTHLRKN